MQSRYHQAYEPFTIRLPGIRELFPELANQLPSPHKPSRSHTLRVQVPVKNFDTDSSDSRMLSSPSEPSQSDSESSNSPQDASSRPGGTRKHACPKCGKLFNRPSSLGIHIHTHTGERPYSCPQPGCTRTFNVSSNMRRHFRAHESEANDILTLPQTAFYLPPGPPSSSWSGSGVSPLYHMNRSLAARPY